MNSSKPALSLPSPRRFGRERRALVGLLTLIVAAGAVAALWMSVFRGIGRRRVSVPSPTVRRVVDDAVAQTWQTRFYDASYVRIAYPGGDVPRTTGVCADVVVRAFRAGGVDLQQSVHEDMSAHFADYPRRWGLRRPDSNIDHRRVPNLMTFFTRKGKALPASRQAADYLPGDVVVWRLGSVLHTGIVCDRIRAGGTPLIIDNRGLGAQMEDVLFAWPIVGHYRYFTPRP